MVKPAVQKQPAQQVTPADTADDAPSQPPAKTPRELPAWKACFTMLCLPVGVLMFITALAGLVVLTGEAVVECLNMCRSAQPCTVLQANVLNFCRSREHNLAWPKLVWHKLAQANGVQHNDQRFLFERGLAR